MKNNSFLKLLSAILAITLILATISINVFATEGDASGTFNGIKWVYDAPERTITLTPDGSETIAASVSGTTYTSIVTKWAELNYDTIIVGEGITVIGVRGLRSDYNDGDGVTKIVLPSTLLTLDSESIANWDKIKTLHIPEGVTNIADKFINGCLSLTSIYFPSTLTSLNNSWLTSTTVIAQLDVYYATTNSTAKGNITNKTLKSKTAVDTINLKSDGSYAYGNFANIVPAAENGDKVTVINDVDTLTMPEIKDGVKMVYNANVGKKGTYQEDTWTYFLPTKTVTLEPAKGQDTILEMTGNNTNAATQQWNGVFEYDTVILKDYTELGENAFMNCQAKAIQLPSTLKTIGTQSLVNNKSLLTLHIPDGVETMGSYPFKGAEKLESMYIPKTITAFVNSWTFTGLSGSSLKNIYFTEGGALNANTITDQLDKSEVTGVTVTAVECMVGNGYSSNTKYYETVVAALADGNKAEDIVYLLDEPKGTMEGDASWSNSVESITIPVLSWELDPVSGILTIGKVSADDYGNCDMVDFGNPPKTPWKNYAESITKVVIESGVTSIGPRAFQSLSNVTEIVIPNTVKTIGYSSLAGTNIKKLEIPSTVTTIQAGVFPACMERLVINNVYTNMHETAFSSMDRKTAIIYASAYTSSVLGRAANLGFERWASLKGDCGDGIEWFYGNNGENTNLSIYGEGAMADYTAEALPTYMEKTIGSIYFAGGLSHIGAYSFYGLNGVSVVEIPDSVTSIGAHAFDNATGLLFVKIPDSVTSIGEGAITSNTVILANDDSYAAEYAEANDIYCTDVTSGKVGDSIEWNFDFNTSTLTIEGEGAIPDYSEENNAPWSYYNEAVKNIDIGLGITKIGKEAFKNFVALIDVDMRVTVTSIESKAFAGCIALEKISLLKTLKSIAEDAFDKTTAFSCYEDSFADTFALANGYETVHPKTLKVLGIGNSFTMNAYQYIAELAKDAGVEEYAIGRLYFGGRQLKTHYEHTQSAPYVDSPDDYAYYEYTNENPTWMTETNKSIAYGLKAQDWDIIIIQGYYNESLEGYNNYGELDGIIEYIEANKTNPDAELGWYGIWSRWYDYINDEGDRVENSYKYYKRVIENIEKDVATREEIKYIIPVGTAIQNMRNTYMTNIATVYDGENYYDFMGDNVHASAHGMYIAGLTWIKALTGLSIDDVTYNSLNLSAENLALVKNAVNAAIQNPNEVSVAELNGKYHTSLEDAIKNAEDGDTVNLIGNSDAEVFYTKDVTVIKGSHTVSGVTYADVTGNGKIDIRDLVRMNEYIKDAENTQLSNGKGDIESTVNESTLVKLRKFLLGKLK